MAEVVAYQAGTVIGGRFKIVAHLRDVASGTTYHAVDDKSQTPVVLHLVRPGLLDEAGFGDLRELSRNAARLSQRNLAATFGVGNEPIFIATEWVDGRALHETIAAHRERGDFLSLRGAYNVIAHVCRGLTALHERMCHGALRPDVVWVTESGRVKITDIGLSRALAGARRMDAFSPAEQASLAPEVKGGYPPTPASDIFGVGAILYQLLTGRSPAEGFIPPSQVHPEATEAIDRILLQCLALDPAARFRSPDDVRAALQPLAAAAHEAAPMDFDIAIEVDSSRVGPLPSTGARPAPPPPRPASNPRIGVPAPPAAQAVRNAPQANDSAHDDVGAALARLQQNDAARWTVSKDKMDHGPFSALEFVEFLLKGTFAPEHPLKNSDTHERKPIEEWPEFSLFVEEARRRRGQEAKRAALHKAEHQDRKVGRTKVMVASTLLFLVVGGVVTFLLTREKSSEETVQNLEGGELFARGEIAMEGTAGILPDPPRRHGSGGARGSSGGGTGFVGSYEDAMNVPIDIGDITAMGGEQRLSNAQVASTINRHLNGIFSACVTPELRRGALGSVTIDVAIRGNGSVMGASARPGSSGFQSCVRNQVRGIRFPTFPAPRMGARYSFSTQ